MNSYYLTLIIKPDLEEKERKELIESVTKKTDKIVKEDLWGVKDMVYPIQKQTKGYFAHFEFESDPGNISGLDKYLKMEEDILRYLLVRV
jgi:small subunit ribosomal protein S6